MNRRAISTIAVVISAAAAGLLAAALFTSWIVVDVRTTGTDAVNLKLPVPLPLVRAATAFIPKEKLGTVKLPPELKENRELILRSLRALLEAPDGALVRVSSDEAKVLIEKKDRTLHVHVEAEDGRVHCAIPIKGVIKALERWDWEHVDPRLATRILASARRGPLVTVDQPDAHVAVSVW